MEAFVDDGTLYTKTLDVALSLERFGVHLVIVLLDSPDLGLKLSNFQPVFFFRRPSHEAEPR